MRQNLSDSELSKLTVEQMNSGLRSYRDDLRYTRDDAVRFVELWNEVKLSTTATIISDGGSPFIVIADAFIA